MTMIGFVGLGHMGAPMAQNLLKHNHQLIVYDVISTAVNALASQGATIAETLTQLAQSADVIITMLPAGQHVKDVCMQDDGLFSHAKPNTLFIDSSSIDVDTSRNLSRIAHDHGFGMIDAPVSGGVAGAKAGTLTFMVGGLEQDFHRAKPILESMGKTIVHAGPAGNGQVAKICNNMILGISMIAVSEAFTLGKKLGLDAEKLFEISSHASGQCWSMTSYCPVPGLVPTAPSNNQYQPGFTADMMLKDLRLSQHAAQSAAVSTPLGAEATALYALFSNLGYGQMDFSAIIQMIAGK
jgi:3-hydroxyisobutyrate dehydrogenase